MNRAPRAGLAELARRVLDGIEIRWDQELERHPGKVEAIRVLRTIALLARTHRAAVEATTRRSSAPSQGPLANRWGPLQVLERIGEGSYGEVFRAWDPRLQVEVALKLFRPSRFATPESSLAEARRLARVRHPNVLLVYGADEHNGRLGMWSELLLGRTLEQLLTSQGPFSARETTVIGIDLCRALAAVHAAGFVHGDVKTSNVMRELGGRIVLMDFGTAGLSQDADSTTGTPITMAYERLLGAPASRASDLYSLGVLLYRMVTAHYPIEASSIPGLRKGHRANAAVPLRDRRSDLPATFVQAIDRAMASVPNQCFATAGELERALAASLVYDTGLATALGDRTSEPSRELVVAPARPRGLIRYARATILLAAIAATGVAVTLAIVVSRIHTMRSTPPLRFSIQLPVGLHFAGYANSAVSPDGRSIAYAAEDSSGTSGLWLRRLDALRAYHLPGTDGAYYPFWSPDSREVGFFAHGFMKKTSPGNSLPTNLCPARAGRGASWSRAGIILFAPNAEGPLYQISAAGEGSHPATALDSTAGEIAHRWPCWMPDGQHFVYTSLRPGSSRFTLYAGAVDSDRRFALGTTSSGVTLAEDALVYLDDQTLVARPFDTRRMHFNGDPVPLADARRFEGSLGEIHASTSNTGVLVYQSLTSRINVLDWVSRDGRTLGRLATGPYFDPRLTPDGKSVAVERAESGTESDIWLIDSETGAATRLTSRRGLERYPIWSPNGSRLLFSSNLGGPYDIILREMQGAGGEASLRTLPHVLLKWPTDWCGRGVVYTVFDPRTGYDVWIRANDGTCAALLARQSNETKATISPDGQWVAFESDESGRSEIYCRHLAGGPSVRIGQMGGVEPRWRADGRELFFRTPSGTFFGQSMPPSSTVGPRELFRVPDVASYDVDRQGKKFICCVSLSASIPSELTVVVNWYVWLRGGH